MTEMKDSERKAILDGLNQSHFIFEGLVSNITPKELDSRRGQGFWTIGEHASHLAEVQPMLLERLKRILKEDTPEFVPFIPDEEEETEQQILPLEQALELFRSGREAIVSLLRSLSEADWNRLAVHPEYAQYGMTVLARHILMHDHWHLYRMEELWLTRDSYLSELKG